LSGIAIFTAVQSLTFSDVDEYLIDLNALLFANSGWELEEPFGINNNGDIVGIGTWNGEKEAFLFHSRNSAIREYQNQPTASLFSKAAILRRVRSNMSH
jgi:hypothetical protein